MDVNVVVAIIGCIGTWFGVFVAIYFGGKKKWDYLMPLRQSHGAGAFSQYVSVSNVSTEVSAY